MKVLSSEDKPGQSPWEKGSTDSSCQASREYSHKPGAERLQELFKFQRNFLGETLPRVVWCGGGALSARLACQPASLRGNEVFLSFWFVSHLVFLLAFSKGSKECSTLAQLRQEKIREKWF